MTRSLRTSMILIGVATLAVSVLAGCAPATSSPSARHVGASAPDSSAPSAADSAAPGAAPTTTPAPPPPAPSAKTSKSPSHKNPPQHACATDDFTITYTAGDSAAGKAHGTLKFINKSGVECVIGGFPDVYFSASGADVGPDATEMGIKTLAKITLEANQYALAAVTVSDGDFVQGCVVDPVTHFDVRPPFQPTGIVVSIPDMDACKGSAISLISVGTLQFE